MRTDCRPTKKQTTPPQIADWSLGQASAVDPRVQVSENGRVIQTPWTSKAAKQFLGRFKLCSKTVSTRSHDARGMAQSGWMPLSESQMIRKALGSSLRVVHG